MYILLQPGYGWDDGDLGAKTVDCAINGTWGNLSFTCVEVYTADNTMQLFGKGVSHAIKHVYYQLIAVSHSLN